MEVTVHDIATLFAQLGEALARDADGSDAADELNIRLHQVH